MPARTKSDTAAILASYAETGNAKETARRLGVHFNTVYQTIRSAAGQCKRCANPPKLGKVYCEACLKHLREKEKVDRWTRRRAGVCVLCDMPHQPPSTVFCADHALADREAHDKLYAKQKATRAVHGGEPSVHERSRRLRNVYGDAAVRVWDRLGGACAACGIVHATKALHIHHIDENPRNNAEENLTLLCQNCHTWTHRLLQIPDPARALAWFRSTYPSVPV